MTTQPERPGEDPGFNYHDTLSQLLAPYEPAASEIESDEQWTTEEIIASLESHYAIPQGGMSPIDGNELITELKKRKFICVNTGGLKLQWLFKRK